MSRLRCVLVVSLACMPLVGAGSAQATTATLGSPLTASDLTKVTFGSVGTFTQTVLPGSTTVSPVTGTIVNWKVLGAQSGPLKLQVVHNFGGGLFTGAGTTSSGPISGTGASVLTFTSHLRINAGELIGVIPTAGSDTIAITPSGPPGINYAFFNPALTDGGVGHTPSGTQARELGLQATVATDCHVPNLKGQKLGPAQTAVTKAGCTNGTATKPKGKKARKKAKFVVGQSPSAGSTVEGLTPVDVTLGKKPKTKKG